ncbi:shikimate kinase [Ignatzschineria rhizosphaerae]|uniref:Shikimate kinase n=2 Tax=Ignatzschineria rhizosphaerae TaxID=2923279 RepID=A0ABY3X3T3_9GAMM|nr:shikimate kinase [Ignatzschineria rhizosphaerae]
MGSGKSTIGKILAKALAYDFVDSDQHVESITGVTIPYIFEMEGEIGFRDREEKAILELTQRRNIVLATGGGAVIRPENRAALAANGIVIYLNVPPESQYERVRFDNQRPLLKNDDPKAVLTALYEVRDPLYRDVADYIVFSDNIPPKVVVSGIIESIVQNKLPCPEWLVGNR